MSIQKGIENADFKGRMNRCYECHKPCWRWCDHCLQPCCKKHRNTHWPYMCDECYEKIIEESRKEETEEDIEAAWGARPSQ